MHARFSRLLIPAALLTALAGCPANDNTNGNDNGNNLGGNSSLSTRERETAAGVLQAAAAIATSAGAAQGATTENDGQSAQQAGGGEIQFGTCPVVTLSGDEDAGEISVEADFGDGCEPIAGTGYMLSGIAAGDVDFQQESLSLSFDELAGAAGELSGQVFLEFDRVGSRLDVTGSFDVALRGSDLRLVSTDGTGAVSFDTDDAATTIERFSGTLSDNGGVWSARLTDVRVSFAVHQNLVPFAGTATVSGTGIRDVTLRFNSDSPLTGEVEASVNGSDFFTVNLFE